MQFLKDYWPQILYAIGIAGVIVAQIKASREATKCSLRNDILQIYTECIKALNYKLILVALRQTSYPYVLMPKLKPNI